MERYINADLVQNCLDTLSNENLIGNENDTYISLPEAKDKIEELPTADVVKVVRCKNCKLRETSGCPMYREEYVHWDDDGYTEVDLIVTDHTVDDGYCSFGKE